MDLQKAKDTITLAVTSLPASDRKRLRYHAEKKTPIWIPVKHTRTGGIVATQEKLLYWMYPSDQHKRPLRAHVAVLASDRKVPVNSSNWNTHMSRWARRWYAMATAVGRGPVPLPRKGAATYQFFPSGNKQLHTAFKRINEQSLRKLLTKVL